MSNATGDQVFGRMPGRFLELNPRAWLAMSQLEALRKLTDKMPRDRVYRVSARSLWN